MKFSTVSSLVLTLLPLVSAAPAPAAGTPDLAASEQKFELLAEQAINATLARLEAEEDSLKKRGVAASCTAKNLSIRRELYDRPSSR